MFLQFFYWKWNRCFCQHCFVSTAHYFCLNPNRVLNLCAVVAPKSVITLIANFFKEMFYWIAFLVHQLVYTYLFYILIVNLDDPILHLYAFCLTILFHRYPLLFLYHFFHLFLCLYQPYLYNMWLRTRRSFWLLLSSRRIPLTHYSLK